MSGQGWILLFLLPLLHLAFQIANLLPHVHIVSANGGKGGQVERPLGGELFERRLRPEGRIEYLAGDRHAELALDPPAFLVVHVFMISEPRAGCHV